MKDVIFEEKTEIPGIGYCPLVGGLCRTDCRFFIDVDDGCMMEKTYRNTEAILEYIEEKESFDECAAMYED